MEKSLMLTLECLPCGILMISLSKCKAPLRGRLLLLGCYYLLRGQEALGFLGFEASLGAVEVSQVV